MKKLFAFVLFAMTLMASTGWSQSRGCHNGICTGDVVYNIARDSVRSRVIAIENSGNYVIEFLEGSLAGQVGSNWSRQNLALPRGCGRSYCVGEQAINVPRDSVQIAIIGIQYDGNYVIEFLEGQLAYKRGSGWSENSLAKMRGCNQDLCVGQSVYNIPRQAHATIVGVQNNGLYVLRFTSGPLSGKKGGNWSRSNLATTSPTDPNRPPPFPGRWTCTTNANGFNFSSSASSREEAYERTLAQCTSSVPNNRGNCRGNMICNQR